ncbi:hypothetical protein BaRGS_00037468 [Batillaria attramentaria]|uniref:BED-type domain-containing protein n=1 Tax=Batillaria attramentaria TaxID=370345 RepID=A0ABD0J8W5_9CAEN
MSAKVLPQKFKPDYTKSFPYLTPSSEGPNHAYCKVCNSNFSIARGGKNDCEKHTKTASHKKLADSLKKNTTLLSAFGKTSSSPTEQKITRAEAT